MKHFSDLIRISELSEKEAWLIVSDEASDPILASVTQNRIVSQAAILVAKDRLVMVVNEMEASNVTDLTVPSNMEVLVYEGNNSYSKHLKQVLSSVGDLKKVILNFSSEPESDFLTHGLYLKTSAIVKEVIPDISFASAESAIKRFFEVKSDVECERISLACRRAEEIIREAFKLTQIGDTEIDIQSRFHQISEIWPDWFDEFKIVGQEYSWEKSLCPIVLVGENLRKGAHSRPSDTAVSRGNTLYCDFGVRLKFSDGEVWSSDLQRMAVMEGDKTAIDHAKKVFDVLYSSVSKAADIMTPTTRIDEIDRAARNEIVSKGYPDYVHTTGHAIGSEAHGIGESIRPNSDSFLSLDGTYTVEPRVKIPNGGSIEEIVRVTETGGQFLSSRQSELIIINEAD